MQPETLRLMASDGIELQLLRWSRVGIPLVLLHGFGNEAHIWDDFAPAIAPYYQVYALDLRGHGDSDWAPDARYDYEHHVADLEAIFDTLGFERIVLVGHSLGGRISMSYAGKHPEKVAGLVIVDSAPELEMRGILRIQMDLQEYRDPSFSSTGEYERYLAHNYPAATPSSIRRMAEYGLKQREDGRWVLKMDVSFRSEAAQAATHEEIEEHSKQTTQMLWDALAKVDCPTLIVRGAASDFLSADIADRMVDEVLAKGSLAVVPQAGHSVMTDNPDGFLEVVTAFVLGD